MIERSQALAALARDEFDVVVVGGGITGAGVALDAATRGYSVALLERADYASGTSSRSSKLVHGGLRYLQNFDLGLVREALLERQLMVALAPHLVRPLPLVVPAFERRAARPAGRRRAEPLRRDVGRPGRPRARRSRAARRGERRPGQRRGAGRARGVLEPRPPPRDLRRGGRSSCCPALAEREPTSGYLFYDCQTDDARLVLTVLGEAERFGAVCANRLDVDGRCSRATGAPAACASHDARRGERFDVRAANVVNATGRVGRPAAPAGAARRGRAAAASARAAART